MTQYKILVVDDEESIRTLVQAMLKGEGRHVVLAARGKDAIAMFQKERPDLTILDIDMPDIDGITILREIRTIDPQAKVMVFTGGESPVVESQAKALGVTDFLRKGFALPSLAELRVRRFAVRSPGSYALGYVTRATLEGLARHSFWSFGGNPCLGVS
jgi:CheY-like chemotaxis protein